MNRGAALDSPTEAVGEVLVSAATESSALPYVEALKAGGLPGSLIRVVTPEGVGAEDEDEAAAASGGGSGGRRRSLAGLRELAAGAAAVMLCGGVDVDPRRYGEEPLAGAGLEMQPGLDALEWELLAVARDRRLPVWGVCRGFQVINVFLGGSLWQDLPLQRPSPVAHDRWQPPDLLAHGLRLLDFDAPLARRLALGGATTAGAAAGAAGRGGADATVPAGAAAGSAGGDSSATAGKASAPGIPAGRDAGAGARPLVNSRHHQGIKRLGAGLLAVAEAPDGLTEAFVLAGGGAADASGGAAERDGWWVRGVEWHPENLLALPEQLALWQDFAAAVRGGGGRQMPPP
jgi:gamma-glutamyl-gamma-aminobutyrate hydrolase PuuD